MAFRKESEIAKTFSINQQFTKKTVITRETGSGNRPHEVITLITEESNGSSSPERDSSLLQEKLQQVNDDNIETNNCSAISATFFKRTPKLLFVIICLVITLVILTTALGTIVVLNGINTKQELFEEKVPPSVIWKYHTENSQRMFTQMSTLTYESKSKNPKQASVSIHRLSHLSSISNTTKNITIFATSVLEQDEWNWETAPKVYGNISLTIALMSAKEIENLPIILQWLRLSIVSIRLNSQVFSETCNETGEYYKINEVILIKAATLEIYDLNRCFFDKWMTFILKFPSLIDCKVIETDEAPNYRQSLSKLLNRGSKTFKKLTFCDKC